MVAVVLLLCACESAAPGSDSDAEPSSIRVSQKGVILPASGAAFTLDQCSRPHPTEIRGFWTPAPAEIAALETLLPAALDSALVQLADSLPPSFKADEYYRQYVGFLRGDRRMIYVNGFHESYIELLRRSADEVGPDHAPVDAWQRELIDACDGGEMFFGVEYDPVSQRLGRIEFNVAVEDMRRADHPRHPISMLSAAEAERTRQNQLYTSLLRYLPSLTLLDLAWRV